MKKIVALVLALIMVMGICGIAAAEDWKFERKIEIVCPWGLGGGADGTLRPMALLLQNILGVPVEVNNVTGAGYKKSTIKRQKTFVDILSAHGVNATVRRTLGSDIEASCGQLRRKYTKGDA